MNKPVINVSADGFVHVGNNQWVSLEQIQQAVLEKQNPQLRIVGCEGCPHHRQSLSAHATEQEPLPLPTTGSVTSADSVAWEKASMFARQKQSSPRRNSHEEEPLPLPVMTFPKR